MRVVTIVALLASAETALAAGPMETVQAVVQKVFAADDAVQVNLGSAPERQARIRQGAEALFDFREMAHRSLGDRWEVLVGADRDEFVRLFTNLIAASYMSTIDLHAGKPILFLGEQMSGEEAAVRSQMITAKGAQVDVEYHLYHPQDRWVVYDVSMNGVSLVGNYRTQFSRLLQRTTFDDLLKTMRQKAGSQSARMDAR